METRAVVMATRSIFGRVEPAMPKRYVVKDGPRMGGIPTFDVVDTQDDTSTFNSFLKTECLRRAKKYNDQEAAIPGGFNKRRK